MIALCAQRAGLSGRAYLYSKTPTEIMLDIEAWIASWAFPASVIAGGKKGSGEQGNDRRPGVSGEPHEEKSMSIRMEVPTRPPVLRRFVEFVVRFAADGLRAQVTNEMTIRRASDDPDRDPRQEEFDDARRRLLERFPWMSGLRRPLGNVIVTYLDDVAKMTKANAVAILRASGIEKKEEGKISPILNRGPGGITLGLRGFDASRLQIVRSRGPRSG